MGCGSSTSIQTGGPIQDKKPLMTNEVRADGQEPNSQGAEAVSGTTQEKDQALGAEAAKERSHGEQSEKDVDSTETLDPSQIWLKVLSSEDVQPGKQSPMKNLVIRRSGWKTVRIFVSSTFKDLSQEREVLIKQVFPDLRIWCEQRRIHLVECDLRWGIPKDTTSENTLRMCLGEIDRCYKDNRMPFFLNLTSERIGWIPDPGEVPKALVDEYRWVFGLSMTEMEIVHGAYRKNNPNSLFMIRREAFLKTVPQDVKDVFLDENPIAPTKIAVLKRMIEERFPAEQIHYYESSFLGMDVDGRTPKLDFDSSFRNRVFEFFKDRISRQYPFELGRRVDPYLVSSEAHEAFMHQRAAMVFGRNFILNQVTDVRFSMRRLMRRLMRRYMRRNCRIKRRTSEEVRDYITDMETGVPLLILGEAGSGKSSIMARAVQDTINLIPELPDLGEGEGWSVFYHFVGAVPGSTDLEYTLNRLLKHVEAVNEGDMPKDLESVASLCCGVLSNNSTRPVIIFIDAINQWDSTGIGEYSSWLPKKLSPNVRVVLSMINGTVHADKLMSRPDPTKPRQIAVTALDEASKMTIVNEYLAQYNKRLDEAQMKSLMAKQSSSSPLWLSIACEELRVFGNYREVENKINALSDGLPELISQVLDRFESEWDGELLVATLCLLEVSRRGLLESELLLILADENPCQPCQSAEKGDKEQAQKEKAPYREKLPAMKWAGVYRLLKQFIRPFGDAGEGRLDFYHRTMSKAVRRKYFGVKEGEEEGNADEYRKWHARLAHYFRCEPLWERKTEEFPTHLIYLGWWDELVEFLCDWRTIDILYNKDYATELQGYWAKIPAPHSMCEKYCDLMRNFMNSSADKQLVIKRTVQICHLLRQVGHYDEALALTSRPEQELEEDLSLQSDLELVADLYQVIAKIMDGQMKATEFMYRSAIPAQVKMIQYWEKVLDLRRKLAKRGKDHQFALGITLNHLAFALCGMTNMGGNSDYPSARCREMAIETSNEAMKLFTELGEQGHVADSLQNLAIAQSDGSSNQKEYYSEALDRSLLVYGEHHELTSRIYLNFGIYYEEQGEYEAAYDCFYKCYYGQSEVLGPDHIRAMRPRKILTEPMYKRIAIERGDPAVPLL